MQPAWTRVPGVVLAAVLLLGVVPSALAAGRSDTARVAPRLSVPFAAPDGYVLTVRPGAETALRATGATPLMADAGIWQASAAAGPALAAQLRAQALLVAVDRNEQRQVRATDPLRPEQWALDAIGLPATAPAPSRKILVIDTGLDLSHPDIAGRPAGTTIAANRQDVSGVDGSVEWHGTAVVSTIAAAVDGQNGEGVYPAATIAMWDASRHPMGSCRPSGCIDGSKVIRGLQWAIDHHYDIVSLSLGSSSPIYAEYLAVERAIAHGILVVAAAGNEAQAGNPYEYPAAYEHVLSVGASNPSGTWASFSNVLPTNDLSAPGTEVYAAIARGFDLTSGGTVPVACNPFPGLAQPGWCQVDGTSFATPITAAAAAWVWSARKGLTAFQLADVLRSGARAAPGQTGYDARYGFGLLDVQGALAAKVVPGDLLEPNDDLPMVRGTSGFHRQRAVLRAARKFARITATADFAEDFEDVYRVDLPRGAKKLKLVLRHRSDRTSGADLDVCVYRTTARTVQIKDDRPSRRARLGCSTARGARPDVLTVRLPRGAKRVYVEVLAPERRSSFADRYTLSLTRS